MLTVIGSINYDIVTTAKRIPDGGETVPASGFATHHGGKGANSARALQRLSAPGTRVNMVGRVGTDSFGDELVDELKKTGIDTTHVERGTERTGIATILVDAEGENRILVYGGANSELTEEKLRPELWRGSKFVLLQNEIPLQTTLVALAKVSQDGVKTVYNPSPMYDIPAATYKNVDYLVVNAFEAAEIGKLEALSTRDQANAALDPLLALGVREAVIVTLGSQGVVYLSRGGERGFVEPVKVDKVVDTTGAGDTFLGAFISQLAEGDSIKGAVWFAAHAAAISVTRKGAASSIPTREQTNATIATGRVVSDD